MKKFKKLLLHVFFPVFLGALIYILFRKETLTVFVWIDNILLLDEVMFFRTALIGVKQKIPQVILYSLPDGIWVYSATYFMAIIWNENSKSISAWFWVSLPLIFSLSAELLQAAHLVEGSYCSYDMIFYISFFILSLLNKKNWGKHAV